MSDNQEDLETQRDLLLQENIAATTILTELVSTVASVRGRLPLADRDAFSQHFGVPLLLAEAYLKDPGKLKVTDIDLVTPQPPPDPDAKGVEVWASAIADLKPQAVAGSVAVLLLEDMVARDTDGRKKHGVPLTAHNGRDAMLDAYQEQLDAVAYFHQLALEYRADIWALTAYQRAVNNALETRRQIGVREMLTTATREFVFTPRTESDNASSSDE